MTALCTVSVVDGLGAQDRATATVEENLRAEPQGIIIGRLNQGSTFRVVRVDGRWVQLEVEGWIWTRSIQVDDREGFDLRVSAAPEENLRTEPSGTVLARLFEGALLNRVEETPGWTLIRREAWAWGPSLELGDAPEAAQTPGGRGEGGIGDLDDRWWRSGEGGAPILTGPDGDTLAGALPGTEMEVLARQGNWVRVRLEGWSWAPLGESTETEGSTIVSSLTPEDVARDPDGHRGQVVAWELQFISQEEAERVRTDFYEGEPFLLTRATSPGRAFVYVAIPPERLGDVEGLIPLERIRVVGRIRTGAAALTGSPILDLLELTRTPGE